MINNNNLLGWEADPTMANNYIECIKKFLSTEDNFSNFRTPSAYGHILEHITKEGGGRYEKYILENYPEFLKKHLSNFKQNDTVGNPQKFNYSSMGEVNPTTVRYIKYAGDIAKRFGDLTDYNLVEIGGGYGGLTRLLDSMYNFKSIKLFDLAEPLKLQSKYLSKFDISCETYTHEDDFVIENNTIVVSNFSWCECDKVTRDKYIKNIISKCDMVYMIVYNTDINKELTILEGEKQIDIDVIQHPTILGEIFTLNKNN